MNMTILIADDAPMIRERLRKLLSSIPNAHIVAEAENGEEAYTLALQHKPDVAVLDIRMPVQTGIEMIAAAKPYLPNTRFFVLTNYFDSSTVAKAKTAGADFVFDKSTEFDMMVQQIASVKESPSSLRREESF